MSERISFSIVKDELGKPIRVNDQSHFLFDVVKLETFVMMPNPGPYSHRIYL